MVVLGDSSPLRLGKIEPWASGVVLAGGLTGSEMRRNWARITLVIPKYPQQISTSEKQGVLRWEVGSRGNLGWCQGCQSCYQVQSTQQLDVHSPSASEQLQHPECSPCQSCPGHLTWSCTAQSKGWHPPALQGLFKEQLVPSELLCWVSPSGALTVIFLKLDIHFGSLIFSLHSQALCLFLSVAPANVYFFQESFQFLSDWPQSLLRKCARTFSCDKTKTQN